MLKVMLKITYIFLEHCSRVNNENIILATFDVVSLYTRIDEHPDSVQKRFYKQFVLE